jgi:hypothetical protein
MALDDNDDDLRDLCARAADSWYKKGYADCASKVTEFVKNLTSESKYVDIWEGNRKYCVLIKPDTRAVVRPYNKNNTLGVPLKSNGIVANVIELKAYQYM